MKMEATMSWSWASRILFALAALCVVGCNRNTGYEGPYPNYASCDTSADCDELLPDCRRILIEDEAREVSMCTRDCSLDGECPNEATMEFSSYGHCVGLDAEGRFDAESLFENSVCLPSGHCEIEGAKCLIPGEDGGAGRCVRYHGDAPEVYDQSIVCLDAPPFYNRCESDADCSVDSPHCRTLDLDDAVAPVRVCVRMCVSEEDTSCKFIPTDPAGYRGRCLGINEQGKPDPEADEIVCLPGCPFLDPSEILRCSIGSGISGARSGSCGFVEYRPGFDPVPVCIEGKVEER